MKTRILIEIKGGCLVGVTTNGDAEVHLLDHDNMDPVEPYPVDSQVTDRQFTALVTPDPQPETEPA